MAARTAACTLLLALVCAGAVRAAPLAPAFPPGYRPDPSTDEGGLWYQIDKLEKQVEASPQRVVDPELERYVHGVACALARDYCPSIRVYVVRNPNFNAMMYPNGLMIVWTGLLLRTENEAQLAAVLGHETAHFLRAHSIEQWRTVRSTAAGAMIIDALLAVTTGVYGVAQLGAIGGLQSFSRSHESEADLYGLQLMTEAGYDGEESARLWDYVIREADNDTSKSGYNAFFASHPRSERRTRTLHEAAAPNATHGRSGQSDYVAMLATSYYDFMQDHLQMQDFGQTEVLLEHHRAMGLPAAEIDFFYGEMYRLRNAPGDPELAVAAYRRSLAGTGAPAVCARELGYLLTRQRAPEAATFLRMYLDNNPGASDREMVEFYLGAATPTENKP